MARLKGVADWLASADHTSDLVWTGIVHRSDPCVATPARYYDDARCGQRCCRSASVAQARAICSALSGLNCFRKAPAGSSKVAGGSWDLLVWSNCHQVIALSRNDVCAYITLFFWHQQISAPSTTILPQHWMFVHQEKSRARYVSTLWTILCWRYVEKNMPLEIYLPAVPEEAWFPSRFARYILSTPSCWS